MITKGEEKMTDDINTEKINTEKISATPMSTEKMSQKKLSVKFHVLAIFCILIFCFALTPVTFQNDTYYNCNWKTYCRNGNNRYARSVFLA